MQAIIVIILCAAAVAAYVVYSMRKDRRVKREHQAVTMALLPGPRIREMTAVRPRRLANKSQSTCTPLAVDDFKHVSTDYGTYTPADVNTAILGHADTEQHSVCVEAPSHSSGHDACSTHDSSYGGGHHGH